MVVYEADPFPLVPLDLDRAEAPHPKGTVAKGFDPLDLKEGEVRLAALDA